MPFSCCLNHTDSICVLILLEWWKHQKPQTVKPFWIIYHKLVGVFTSLRTEVSEHVVCFLISILKHACANSPSSVCSACTQLSLMHLLCLSQAKTLCSRQNDSCKGSTAWINDVKKQNKVNKVVKHERNGFNHASGSESDSPHPCREGNERVFLCGWIWIDSRYSQSWSSLYLPVIEA